MYTIDLHGLNREEAQRRLEEALVNATTYGEKVIRIIHGRGKHSESFPVLKSWVRHWLASKDWADFTIYRGEDGSPYTPPNPGEMVVALRENENPAIVYSWEDEAEEREARNHAKGMRADRLRKLRRKRY